MSDRQAFIFARTDRHFAAGIHLTDAFAIATAEADREERA